MKSAMSIWPVVCSFLKVESLLKLTQGTTKFKHGFGAGGGKGKVSVPKPAPWKWGGGRF